MMKQLLNEQGLSVKQVLGYEEIIGKQEKEIIRLQDIIDENLIKCDSCDNYFTDDYNLWNHEDWRTSGGEQNICQICADEGYAK